MAKFEIKKNGKLFNPQKYDFSAALNARDIKGVYQLSGMRDIVATIENQLKRKGILSSLFVEFNLLGTILDPSSKDELNSFTYIKNNTPGFSDGVMRYSSRIIQWLFEVYGSTLFYNPNIFLDPQSPQVLYSVLDKQNIDENFIAQIALIRAFKNKKIKKEDEDKVKVFIDHLRDTGTIHTEDEYDFELLRFRSKYIFLPDDRTLFEHINCDSQKELFKLSLLESYPEDSRKQYESLNKEKTKFAGSSKFSRKYEDILQTASEFRQREDKTEEDFCNFHSFYHWCIPNNGKTVYLAIPVLGTPSSNRITKKELNNIQGQGVVFVFFDLNNSYSGDIVSDIEEISTVLYDRLGDIVRTLTYNYLFNVGMNLSEEVKKESIKSAISAIMSRNMSHNLGSHCMHYTRTTLDNLAGAMFGHGPEIRGAAKLMGYIQARMDFLATLVSGEEYPYGAVNFKSQLLDVITIDDFSKRHYEASNISQKYTAISTTDGIETKLLNVATLLKEISENNRGNDKSILLDVVNQTEELIKQLDSIPLDNTNLRTTNFLLENLIKSEHFFREDIRTQSTTTAQISCNGSSQPSTNTKDKHFYLHVRYNGKTFTGVALNKQQIETKLRHAKRSGDNSETQRLSSLLNLYQEEQNVKSALSEISIAMPGGIMSSHAFFNILENLIRNSAKHRASDLKENSLVTTIDIRDSFDKDNPQIPMYQFSIYDNKKNAGKVFSGIKSQLEDLQILNEDSSINKKSKGLKEMLIAALWLKSNSTKSNYSELLSKIENAESANEKIALISKNAFQLIAVDDNGDDLPINGKNANFGLRFSLPRFETKTTLEIPDRPKYGRTANIVNAIKNKHLCADIIEITQNKYEREALKRFPRIILAEQKPLIGCVKLLSSSVIEDADVAKDDFNNVIKYYCILSKRFGPVINNYKIVFDENNRQDEKKGNIIYFRRHFNKGDDFSTGLDYLYADSVSGGNYTITLRENYLKSINSQGLFYTWKDKYAALKILESALTRITIIDERLSESSDSYELMMKNIRVLNLDSSAANADSIWKGNTFKDGDDYTLFLTIHLGLIEKVIGNDNNWFMKQYKKKYANKKNKPEKASFFMDELKKKFGRGREIFISIHSGRGNYSYDLEHSLKRYPFINLSAIESVFSNSKFLLSQLFYNTIYIGKGEYNQY